MGSPGDYGLCPNRITPTAATCTPATSTAIGDDPFKEEFLVCGEVGITWSGDSAACRRQYAGSVASETLLHFRVDGDAGAFRTPLTLLKRVGTSPAVCREDKAGERTKLGLAAAAQGSDCYITPSGSGKRLLSYPVQAKVGLAIEDVRNEWTRRIIRFRVGTKEIGIGTAAAFTLKDGSAVRGIIVNVGFVPLASAWPAADGSPAFLPKNVNLYIYTTRSKEDGRLVKLDEVTAASDLTPDEMAALAKAYREDHRSIQELIDDLQKNSPQGPDVVL